MSKMRHIFGFSRNAQRHFQNAREGVPDAPFSRNCARSGSTAGHRKQTTFLTSTEEERERFFLLRKEIYFLESRNLHFRTFSHGSPPPSLWRRNISTSLSTSQFQPRSVNWGCELSNSAGKYFSRPLCTFICHRFPFPAALPAQSISAFPFPPPPQIRRIAPSPLLYTLVRTFLRFSSAEICITIELGRE